MRISGKAGLLAGMTVFLGMSPAEAKVELTWWHAMSGQLGAVLDEVVAKFNASQDEYELVATNKGNYVATLNASIAAYRVGEPPLIMQASEGSVLTMMLSNAVIPAQELLEQYGYDFDPSDYLSPVLGTYTNLDGKLLAMPFNSSTPILFYNGDILEAGGITEPPATWQEIGQMSRDLIVKGVTECGYSFGADHWVEYENYSVYHNQPYATLANGHGGLDAEIVINAGPVPAHLQMVKDWLDEGIATFGAEEPNTWGSGARTNFLDGKCAFWIGSTAWHGTVEEGAKFNWDGARLPYDEGTTPNSSMIGGAALYVFKEHTEEEYAGAAAFFDFLTSPELQVFWHQATGYVPITKTAYEMAKAEGYYETHPSREYAILQLLQGEPSDASKTIRLGNFEVVREVINEEIRKALANEISVQEALDNGTERGNELLRRYEQQNAGKL